MDKEKTDFSDTLNWKEHTKEAREQNLIDFTIRFPYAHGANYLIGLDENVCINIIPRYQNARDRTYVWTTPRKLMKVMEKYRDELTDFL